MTVVTLLIIIGLIALAFYANNRWVDPGMLRTIFNVILMIICIVVVLALTGLIGSIRNIRV